MPKVTATTSCLDAYAVIVLFRSPGHAQSYGRIHNDRLSRHEWVTKLQSNLNSSPCARLSQGETSLTTRHVLYCRRCHLNHAKISQIQELKCCYRRLWRQCWWWRCCGHVNRRHPFKVKRMLRPSDTSRLRPRGPSRLRPREPSRLRPREPWIVILRPSEADIAVT